MSLTKQIEKEIHKIIEPLVKHGNSIIDPVYVAKLTSKAIDPDNESPELTSYSSLMYLRNAVRRLLARNFDPVEKARQGIIGKQQDMFSGTLQDYYPIKRLKNGDKILLLYAKRQMLSDDDAERICLRMEKAGVSLRKHAKALRKYQQMKANKKNAA